MGSRDWCRFCWGFLLLGWGVCPLLESSDRLGERLECGLDANQLFVGLGGWDGFWGRFRQIFHEYLMIGEVGKDGRDIVVLFGVLGQVA